MAETITIARPYAQAVFDLAKADGRLQAWSDTLGLLATIADDPNMRAFIENPRVANKDILDTVFSIAGDSLDETAKNFVKVLAENNRLALLPEIEALYEQHRAEAEKTVQAEMVSAYEVDKAQQASIAAALKKRLGRDVVLTCKVDESMLGGAVIRAGDLVIDGSITGQLNRLALELAH